MEKNAAQEEAIASIDGQVLLISCPGSGKTTTMIRRIKAMIDKGIDAGSIVMVTFTEAAAGEMKSRFETSYNMTGPTFCTIHSLCLKILSMYGTSPVRIMSTEEQNTIIRRAMSAARIPAGTAAKDALCDISAYKNSARDMLRFRPSALNGGEFRLLYQAYEDMKGESDLIDFDDLLTQCKELLENNEKALCDCRKRYRYIMCDEYQDTNYVQKEILYLLAGRDGNICVVGDDDQSIYGFRGANPHIMMDFQQDYPNVKSIRMDINYRSRPEIIEAASNLIGRNKERFEKDIRAARSGHGEVRYMDEPGRTDEIDRLADEIWKLISIDGCAPASIAVLARTNQQLEDVAAVFERRGILYTSNDAIKDVYEHFIFRDILAYINLASGRFQVKDLLQVLNKPLRYLKERDFAGVKEFTESALVNAAEMNGKAAARMKASVLYEQVAALRGLLLKDQVKDIIETIGYRRYIEDYANSTEQNLDILENKLEFFLRDSEKYVSADDWYAAANAHVQKHRQLMRQRSGKSVMLATMHRSKGLEWDTVFLIDCVKGCVPSPKAKTSEEIEEERRLFYVAVTRAKERLYLLRYKEKKSRGKTSAVTSSVFLEEMKSAPVITNRIRAADAEKKRDESRIRIAADFEEGDPKNFITGMEVHHKSFGTGIVLTKTLFATSIRFPSGVKVFPRGR